MPDIHIRREHDLGLEAARTVAQRWMDDARDRLGMSCQCDAGEATDTIRFERAGASGVVEVSGQCFELRARLGFLLGAFSERIEQEITRNLDELLARPQ
jgi:putative polyhydroxyalkanoate system protein